MSRSTLLDKLRIGAPVVLPALLLCDFADLRGEVRALEEAGVKGLHLDVMDGHFVPNITYGMTIVEAVRRVTDLPLDVHLMIAEPARYVEAFADAGADILTIHREAVDDPRSVLDAIRARGMAAGLALNPSTPVSDVAPLLDACDLVLVMGVMPGFGGQQFNPVAVDKLRQLRELAGPDMLLEVDGGINEQTIGACAEAGADLCVAGSAIFCSGDYAQSVTRLTGLAKSVS